MSTGKSIRLQRIFKEDGKAVIFAADHGLIHGPIREVYKLPQIVELAIRGGIDAILLSPGQAQRIGYLLTERNNPALLLRGDWISAARIISSEFLPTSEFKRCRLIEPLNALRLGASGIVLYLFIGYSDDYDSLNYEECAKYAEECIQVGIPLFLEPLVIPLVQSIDGIISSSLYEYIARASQAIGADALKVEYPQDKEIFEKVVLSAGIPTLILGGEKLEKEKALQMADEALSAGAKGIVFGRQILQSDDPEGIIKELVKLVHKSKSDLKV